MRVRCVSETIQSNLLLSSAYFSPLSLFVSLPQKRFFSSPAVQQLEKIALVLTASPVEAQGRLRGVDCRRPGPGMETTWFPWRLLAGARSTGPAGIVYPKYYLFEKKKNLTICLRDTAYWAARQWFRHFGLSGTARAKREITPIATSGCGFWPLRKRSASRRLFSSSLTRAGAFCARRLPISLNKCSKRLNGRIRSPFSALSSRQISLVYLPLAFSLRWKESQR